MRERLSPSRCASVCVSKGEPWCCGSRPGSFFSLSQLQDLKDEIEKRQAKTAPRFPGNSQLDTEAQGREEKKQQPVSEFIPRTGVYGEGKSRLDGISQSRFASVASGDPQIPRG